MIYELVRKKNLKNNQSKFIKLQLFRQKNVCSYDKKITIKK